MGANLTIDDLTWYFDPENPIDISIPLYFNGPQPNAYGVEPATSTPCAAGELVGDTRQGGSCNFEQYTLIPHCNGTHTECVGHITHERIAIRDSLRDTFIPALVVSVTPERAAGSADAYSMTYGDEDLIISRASLEATVAGSADFRGLIVRTLPNDETKLSREYRETIPPYFSTDAMKYIVELGIDHLLVDLPSIDRLYDEGRLSNHRVFWNVEPASFEISEETRRTATITELAYIPDKAADGLYLLNLQIAPFVSDAAPSRPLLFPIIDN
jgi:kynurenine formamidase